MTLQDVIDRLSRWQEIAQKSPGHGYAQGVSAALRIIEDFRDELAAGIPEPTQDGLWWIDGEIAEPLETVYVKHRKEWWIEKNGEWQGLNGRRVWPVIDPRKGGA